MTIRLAKDVIDFGLYTNDRNRMLAFWQNEVGLPFQEKLPAGGGTHQLRHGMNGSVMKINHARDPLPPARPSGYRELWIARPGLTEERRLVDPEGNHVRLVPPGTDGVEGIGLFLGVRDEAAQHRFYTEVLELQPRGERAYGIGGSILHFAHDPGVPRDVVEANNGKMRAPGFRYMTIQVWDVDAVHGEIVSRGGMEGFPPLTLGKVARISFVRDPDGNWIELSQRASLTGEV
ncbi:MAG: VOC family protein [Candidatus Binatia bacterium]|nr:VOC family protein [Candidatus Binatia bacterium]